MSKGENLAKKMIELRGWRGGANLTETGLEQLIVFSYKQGYNAAMKENNKEPALKPNKFENVFGDFFENHTGKKY